MTDPMHPQLLGHLLGALDDDEQEWLESRLEHDAEYRRQWMNWRRRLAPLLAARPDIEPPEDLAERTCRLVAASAPAPARVRLPRRAMSPDATPAGGGVRAGWLDRAVAALVVALVVALVPPAIHGSRFHARLTSCEARLQQVGLALTQYGYRHGSDLTDLADDERLNGAGLFAAGAIDDRWNTDGARAVCPDAWLAVQGVLRLPRRDETWMARLQGRSGSEAGPQLVQTTWFHGASASSSAWLGTWRNGTVDGAANPLPTAVAVFADVPSVDLPGQAADCHGGQGRNMFFEDGHVDFQPCSVSRDEPDAVLSQGDSLASPGVFVPVTFVNWR